MAILLPSGVKGLQAYLMQCGASVSDLPTIAGQYSGKSVVVCADAACIWDDLERFGARSDEGSGQVAKPGWDFMTVNKMVEVFPGRIEHCYSNEPQTLIRFIAARRHEYAREFSGPMHSHSISAGCNWKWPFGGFGTSGLGATLVALCLGYDRVVLCGMPLDNSGHNGEPHWRRCHFETSESAGDVVTGEDGHWKMARQIAFEGKVKSMSGRTMKWLGDASSWA